ncbi:hypothetical protein L1987_53024 [Smallanthus sonchifolius]|uniref:Uncharacterized protein n=1 Tax=Smallanthus sonchifolius TaxID=185202 RepID=A0ACB9EUQ7_9ASTR|nr:hypothetical protein L1987_53024 [Smallanthus sonchifolius]
MDLIFSRFVGKAKAGKLCAEIEALCYRPQSLLFSPNARMVVSKNTALAFKSYRNQAQVLVKNLAFGRCFYAIFASKMELQSVCGQLAAEQSRCFKLEFIISIQVSSYRIRWLW